MSFRRSKSAYSSRSSRTSSRFSFVESNFRLEEPVTPLIPEVRIVRKERPRSHQLTIDDAPMMLLPKARVRESLDFYNNRGRTCGVVADTSTQGLHISTIQSVNAMQIRTPSKSAMKLRCSSATGHSDVDSGIGSMKRSVTFDNLTQSRSTVYRSTDDLENIDNLSDISNDDKDEFITPIINDDDSFFRLPPLTKPDESLPQHLDTFGIDEPTLSSAKPRTVSKTSSFSKPKRRKHSHSDGSDLEACEICGTVLTDQERVQRKFGKVDTFLDWVLSKWGKAYSERLRRELQYIPRPSYVFRGHVPHFCNFVHKLHLHSKNVGSSDSMGMPDSELGDEIDLVAESVDGSLIGQWRKTSNARGSGIEGRPGSPSSVDGVEKVEEEEEANSQPVTGIEIRITPSLHSNSSDKVSKQGASKDSKHSKANASQGIPEEDPDALSPPKTPADAWNEDYGKSSTLSLGKIPTSGIDSDENNNREPSPRQPPPSPEPIPLPTAPKTPPPSKKRSCINKKTKKPVDRTRKMKEIELPKEPDPPKEELEVIPPLESERLDSWPD